mmetsp:Transcript_19573/g.34562  ORF Transcript_19573/g.34562 Transcript_19573/m.34562 type:complete len:297 (-) Transcript_19573:206-1096(-)|eukprot:CAMPEP_0197624948 /NCGR_PEP_ID=MMETSP1338-20131121/4435_1 /TAXON_ID=43686 ORGANISM="Pelagodinium beii, Strain RCC1491" /NCGR_SAMPLE_ID=MMETSP1338 /ASSEMBLY_ACC=CAM_ASM_000754 /LENGTH=296 /DNA_ID=CAMNT_0043195213 /DNA_START=150 /DNA_END=1040 /DNA_ORIENTATION=+
MDSGRVVDEQFDPALTSDMLCKLSLEPMAVRPEPMADNGEAISNEPIKVKLAGDAFNDDVSTTIAMSAMASELSDTETGIGEGGVNSWLLDLKYFGTCLLAYMSCSEDSFRGCDQDVAACVSLSKSTARDLVSEAQLLANRLSSTNIQVFDLLPEMAQADALASGTLQEAEQGLIGMRTEITQVRSMYLRLLDRVKYLVKCVDASLCLICEETSEFCSDVPQYLTAANLVSFGQDKPAQSADINLSNYDRVHMGKQQLCAIIDMLEDPSEFWLMLHSVELELEAMEEGVQCIALSL